MAVLRLLPFAAGLVLLLHSALASTLEWRWDGDGTWKFQDPSMEGTAAYMAPYLLGPGPLKFGSYILGTSNQTVHQMDIDILERDYHGPCCCSIRIGDSLLRLLSRPFKGIEPQLV